MASTMASAGEQLQRNGTKGMLKSQLFASISRLSDWLEKNDYRGYDTFDGLNARYVRPLTFESPLLRTVLQQGVRRFPLNMRPLLGVKKSRSTKGMGFLARGFMRLHSSTGNEMWRERAESALEWLIANQSPGYSGSCWGNHFDYQSRTFYLPKGVPTIVWTSLIGHAFLDGYDQYQKQEYLDIAVSACEHIVHDLSTAADGEGACISYIPGMHSQVHNANVLGEACCRERTRTHAARGTWSWRARQCSIRRSTSSLTEHGGTEKKRTCTGWITSTPRMCWIASSTMRSTAPMVPLTRRRCMAMHTGRKPSSCRTEHRGIISRRPCRLIFSAVRKRLTRLCSFPTGIRRV